jgi:hypothetical protein
MHLDHKCNIIETFSRSRLGTPNAVNHLHDSIETSQRSIRRDKLLRVNTCLTGAWQGGKHVAPDPEQLRQGHQTLPSSVSTEPPATRDGRLTTDRCARCRDMKVRCSGNVPCNRCQKSGEKCYFKSEDARITVSQRQANCNKLMRPELTDAATCRAWRRGSAVSSRIGFAATSCPV